MEKNGNGVTTKLNVARLQVQMDQVLNDVRAIRDNHLPHLSDRIEGVEKKIAYWSGGVGVVLLIVQLIIGYIKK